MKVELGIDLYIKTDFMFRDYNSIVLSQYSGLAPPGLATAVSGKARVQASCCF